MVKPRLRSFTLTMSLRQSLMDSLEKLSLEIRRLSFLSLVYWHISFSWCYRGWICLMNQHMARSKPVRPVSTSVGGFVVGGKKGLQSPCRGFGGGPIDEIWV